MSKLADGWHDGYQQYEMEPNDEALECDSCGVDFAPGDTYWTCDDEAQCELCWEETKEGGT